MSASPDRLAQVDAQLAALGVDEASAQTRVLRLLEQRPRDLDAIDAALNGLAEGLDLAAVSRPRPRSEIPLSEREPERSTEELSLDDLALPSEVMAAAPAPASVAPAPPASVAPRRGSAAPPPPASVAPRRGSAAPPPPASVAPRRGSAAPPPPPPRPASAMPPPIPSRPAPAIADGLDADSLFDEMGEGAADAGMELELDALMGDKAVALPADEALGDAFGFEDGGDATGLFSADDLAAIQDEPSAPLELSSLDDDFDLLIDDGELADEAPAAEDAGLDDDDDDPDKKEAGFFKKLFG